MRDQKAVIGAFERRPAAHPRAGPGLQQVDRRPAAEIVPPAVRREMPLVRAPAQLGRLRAFADEAVDRPGVDELAGLLRDRRDLRVALGDMDRLDAEPLGEARPAGAVGRRLDRRVGVAGEVEQRLLDEMRDEAGIGAVRDDRGRAALPRDALARSASALSRSA